MDRIEKFDISQVAEKLDANGFLRVKGYAARTGVLQYNSGSEYVSPETLFNNDSIMTMIGSPVTVRHTIGGVNPSNAKDKVVGSVVAAGAEGDKLRVDLVIYNSDAIEEVNRGTRELSCGYTCQLDKADGNIDGEHFNSKQLNRIYNHLAIVSKGRAGAECSIKLDQQEKDMELQEKLDATLAELAEVKASLENMQSSNDELQGKHDALEAELTEAKADSSERLDEAQVKTVISDLLEVVESAKVLKADSAPVVDGKVLTSLDVMIEALGLESEGHSEEYVKGRFDSAVELKKNSDSEVKKLNKKADSAPYVSGRDLFIQGK